MFRLRSLLFLSVIALAAGILPLNAQSVAAGPWSGGVTSDAATVVARPFSRLFATLEGSTSSDFAKFLTFGETSDRPGDQPDMSHFRAVGLKPSTRSSYRIRVGAQRDEQRTGRFTTLPWEEQAASFRFAFSSGANAGTDHGVYSEIKSGAPLFFTVTGNLHDAAFRATDRDGFRAAYESVLFAFTQANLDRTVPLVSTWDARDYGAAGSAVPARAAAHASFREYFSFPTLADPATPEGTINHRFTVGRVRFLGLDVRTERGPAGTTMLGARQLAWPKGELLAARERYPLTLSSALLHGYRRRPATMAGDGIRLNATRSVIGWSSTGSPASASCPAMVMCWPPTMAPTTAMAPAGAPGFPSFRPAPSTTTAPPAPVPRAMARSLQRQARACLRSSMCWMQRVRFSSASAV